MILLSVLNVVLLVALVEATIHRAATSSLAESAERLARRRPR